MSFLDVLRDGAALLLTWVIAGLVLGYSLMPGRLDLSTRLRLSLALSVPATILILTPFLPFGLLGGATFLGGVVLFAGIATFRLRSRLAQVSGGMRAIRSRVDGLSIASWLLPVVVMAVVWLAVLRPQLAARRSDGLPLGATVWYYWRLVRMVLSEGGVPASIVEWGASRPFPTEYVLASVHAAVTSVLADGADLALLERYRLFMVVLGLLAAQALWRRWLPRWWSWIAAVLTLSTPRLSSKFTAYRPETFGLLLVLWSSWLLDEALERRSPRWAALAGLVSACAYLSHAEIWLLTGPLWLGIVLSRLVASLGHRFVKPGDAPVSQTRTDFVTFPSPQSLVAAAATFAVMVGLVTGLIGEIGRIGELIGMGSQPSVTETASSADSTWALNAALYRPSNLQRDPPQFCADFLVVGATRTPFEGIDLRKPGPRAGLGVALLLLVVAVRFLPGSALVGTLVWVVYVLGLYAGASVICVAFDTYVPERAGPSRLMPYYVLGLVWLITVLGWGAAKLLTVLTCRLIDGKGRLALSQVMVVILPTAVASLLLLLTFTPITRGAASDEEGGLAPAAYQALNWMRTHLPDDSIVLANGYTAGSIGSVSGLAGWLDGRVPYLESSEWRVEATRRALDARRYFQDPYARSDLLPPEVDYVLIARSGVVLGGSNFATDLDIVRQTPHLRLIRSFGGDRVELYQVVREGADRSR